MERYEQREQIKANIDYDYLRRQCPYDDKELNSDEKLAQEMGMSVSKLNRIIRLSEAAKDVCSRVGDGSPPLSIASAISFLKPQQEQPKSSFQGPTVQPTSTSAPALSSFPRTLTQPAPARR